MLTSSQVDHLRPFVEKYKPFVSLWTPKNPDLDKDGVLMDTTRNDVVKKRQSVFTYKNIHGAALSLKKLKYTWVDNSEKDPETDKVTKFVEATLKREDLGTYQWEEAYERNEFERIAFIENWPSSHTIEMMQRLPEKLEKELETAEEARVDMERTVKEQEAKVKNVVANYATMFSTYETARMEVTALAIEIPTLKNTPFEPTFFKDLLPVAENAAKIQFPEIQSDATKPAAKAKA